MINCTSINHIALLVEDKVSHETTYLTGAILLCSTVTEECAIFRVSHVMTPVTHPGTHGTHPNTINHTAGVAVVPVLVHEFLLGEGEGAQLVAHTVFILLGYTNE